MASDAADGNDAIIFKSVIQGHHEYNQADNVSISIPITIYDHTYR